MRAGQLNQIISIYGMDSITDEYGSVTKSLQLLTKTKAQVKFNSGNRETDSEYIYHSDIITFTIRDHYKVNEEMTIEYYSRKYKVLSIEPDVQNRTLTIKTERIIE